MTKQKQIEDYTELKEKFSKLVLNGVFHSKYSENSVKDLLLEQQAKIDSLNKNKECLTETNRILQADIDELKRNRFVRFNNEDCLPWCEDNRDLENISCPIIISPVELKEYLDKIDSLKERLKSAEFADLEMGIAETEINILKEENAKLTEQNKEFQEKQDALRDQAWIFKQFMGKVKTVIGFGHSRSIDELKLSALELVHDYESQFKSNEPVYLNKESK